MDRNPSHRSGGFTLIEVMIAAVVLVAGMLSIMGLFGVALATHRSNIDTARLAAIRADVLPEALREAVEIDPETEVLTCRDLDRRPAPGHPGFFYELRIESSDADSGAHVAALTVSWWGGGRQQTDRSRHVFRAEKSFADLIRTRFKEERQP